jgi:molybdopterin converting factor small subunit
MTVTTLLFASYADALGRSAVALSLTPGATVADAVAALRSLPGGDRLPDAPRVAVNLEFAPLEQELRGGDEVALIPPVAGG